MDLSLPKWGQPEDTARGEPFVNLIQSHERIGVRGVFSRLPLDPSG
jgi:hypothetical protein